MAVPEFASQAGAALSAVMGHGFQWFGTFSAGNATTVNIYSGKGVPTATVVPGPRAGDLYFRVDGGGAGTTHIYVYNAGAWLGIA